MRLIPTTLSQTSSGSSKLCASEVKPVSCTPALLCRMSSRPNASTVSAINRLTSSTSETSARTNAASPPAARIAAATAVPVSSLMSETTTRAPSSAIFVAVALPIPWPAPVTIATLPSSLTAVPRSA